MPQAEWFAKQFRGLVENLLVEESVAFYFRGTRFCGFGKFGATDGLSVHFDPMDIILDAADAGATEIVLTHNHPSGILFESPADLEATHTIAKLARGAGMIVSRHILVTKHGHAEFYTDRG